MKVWVGFACGILFTMLLVLTKAMHDMEMGYLPLFSAAALAFPLWSASCFTRDDEEAEDGAR